VSGKFRYGITVMVISILLSLPFQFFYGSYALAEPNSIPVGSISAAMSLNSYTNLISVTEQTVSPVLFDHLYSGYPVFCIFGNQDDYISESMNAIYDWQAKLRNTSGDFHHWNMTVLTNPANPKTCTTEIHIMKYPEDLFWQNMGIQYNTEKKGIIWVYTETYYFLDKHKLVKESSGKWRPIPFDYEDIPINVFGSVVRHELGHDFGLEHQANNSIMVTGFGVNHITREDCLNVIKKFGNDWKDHTSLEWLYGDNTKYVYNLELSWHRNN